MENSEHENSVKSKKKWSLKKKIAATGITLLVAGSAANAMGDGGATQSEQPVQQTNASSQASEAKTEQITETNTIPYETITQDDSTLTAGETLVAREGKDGAKVVTYEITYVNGTQTSKKQIGEPVITQPISKVVKNGTYSAPAASSAYYPNCSAARAAGAAPIYAGEPGYASKLDRDNDGIACE